VNPSLGFMASRDDGQIFKLTEEYRGYIEEGWVESGPLFTSPYLFDSVSLSGVVDQQEPPDTSIDYFANTLQMSENGSLRYFPETSSVNDLRWQAYLKTTDKDKTPEIDFIQITANPRLIDCTETRQTIYGNIYGTGTIEEESEYPSISLHCHSSGHSASYGLIYSPGSPYGDIYGLGWSDKYGWFCVGYTCGGDLDHVRVNEGGQVIGSAKFMNLVDQDLVEQDLYINFSGPPDSLWGTKYFGDETMGTFGESPPKNGSNYAHIGGDMEKILWTPESFCEDECSSERETRCSEDRSSVQTCGDYDEDNCLEWSDPIPCGECKHCDEGDCVNNTDLTSCTGGKCCGGVCNTSIFVLI